MLKDLIVYLRYRRQILALIKSHFQEVVYYKYLTKTEKSIISLKQFEQLKRLSNKYSNKQTNGRKKSIQ